MVSAPAKRTLVRMLQDHGLSERRALRVAGMSASALRYIVVPEESETQAEASCPIKGYLSSDVQASRRGSSLRPITARIVSSKAVIHRISQRRL